jgi:glucose-6-phosphate-specific signal transduction histidine kinase
MLYLKLSAPTFTLALGMSSAKTTFIHVQGTQNYFSNVLAQPHQGIVPSRLASPYYPTFLPQASALLLPALTILTHSLLNTRVFL